MMKELLVSVASGVIVALLLQMFRFGGRTEPRDMRQSMPRHAPPRRRSGIGGLFRFILAVVGGLLLAGAAAPYVLPFLHGGRGGPRGGFYGGSGGRGHGWFNSGYYDGPDHFTGIFGLPPMLVLTVIGTIVVWLFLSALTRR
jgi:hypothetical protein